MNSMQEAAKALDEVSKYINRVLKDIEASDMAYEEYARMTGSLRDMRTLVTKAHNLALLSGLRS